MTLTARAFLDHPTGVEVRRKVFTSERRARRWCRRHLNRFDCLRRHVEIKRGDRLLWSGESFNDGEERTGAL